MIQNDSWKTGFVSDYQSNYKTAFYSLIFSDREIVGKKDWWKHDWQDRTIMYNAHFVSWHIYIMTSFEDFVLIGVNIFNEVF